MMPIVGGRYVSQRASSTYLSSRNRTIIALISISVVSIFLLSSSNQNKINFVDSNFQLIKNRPEHSFVKSLEKFLGQRGVSGGSAEKLVPVDGNLTLAAAKRLDDAMSRRENLELREFRVGHFPLRVYVYDMPSKFTYDLLWLFHKTYRETANLTSNGSPVHRLIEQHSVDYWLWADLIAPENERQLKTVVRVHRQEEADLFYIPFFTTISFFLLEKAECKQLYREALRWITDQPAWQRSNGRDHILPVHHPWSFKSVRRFVKDAIWLLPDMDSTGNWYKPGEVWLEKDLILPYVANVDACDGACLVQSWAQRKTLLFFRGRLKRNAGGKIRSKLVALLQHNSDVIIEEGSSGEVGKLATQTGMRSSMFCLSPAGDTPSSARLFDAIVSGCIPVIVSDELELPFEGILDYRKVALFVSSHDALEPGWLIDYLHGIKPNQVKEMRSDLAKFSKHFQFSSPAQPLGPEDLTWKMIAGKLTAIKMHIRRSQRVVNGSRNSCICECKLANSTKHQ
ncbi:hypothetical protein SUGI_1077050 [Cryptomeria japonica]|uniref:probable arabinosyltransferase ARAD1 n=1 Tax=Cryptomeria japonica TaxID=3369 RepID=UPI002414C6D8|nr:probable arabinosyltransferase ARAD1 [Cryptomeria japonica]GLJ50553.1 hypothetical protein SUGI_1077050 [Cryptomeria japonica]